MKKYIFSIWLNDKDTKKQIIDTALALSIISKEVAEAFGGGTIYEANGVFSHEDNSIVQEKTIRVETLDFINDNNVFVEFAKRMRDKLNQESVLMEIVDLPCSFI